jgi:hypothetical protein
MARSILALVAAVWFAINAIWFLPLGAVYPNDGAPGGIDGDPASLAVTWAARTLFVGMTLLALAQVECGPLIDRVLSAIEGEPKD